MNGDISPREKLKPSVIENHKKETDRERSSPRSDASSHGSSSSVKHTKEVPTAEMNWDAGGKAIKFHLQTVKALTRLHILCSLVRAFTVWY